MQMIPISSFLASPFARSWTSRPPYGEGRGTGKLCRSQVQNAAERERDVVLKPGEFGRAICREVAHKEPQMVPGLPLRNFPLETRSSFSEQ